MRKTKLMTILGTRPEIIRLSATIKTCDKYFDHVLVHTGQNWDYTLNEVFFKELEIRKPDHFLNVPGKHLGETMGNIISASYEILQQERPDALLILGDTNSALSAISAKRLKIPIFHMEAGNRCFDQNVPEEINRKLVDHVSDINLPYTEHSRRYLMAEGFRKEHIFVTGSPLPEVLYQYMDKIESSNVLKRIKLYQGKYILVSAHREENLDIDKNFEEIVDTLNMVANEFNLPVIYSTHPRAMKKIKEKSVRFNSLITNLEAFGFFDYIKLQKNAFCVLSDSGTLSEESAILGFPAVLFRTSTERPEAIDAGTVVLGGTSTLSVISGIRIATQGVSKSAGTACPSDYTDSNVSEKVARIIQGYFGVVNRFVWGKT